MFDLKKVLRSAVHSIRDDSEVSPGTEGYGRDQIDSFYKALSEGLYTLEKSLPPDSLSFRVDWLQLAVAFLHQVHSNAFQLVENLLLPAESPSLSARQGPEYLNDYLDVSMSILDMCNSLKEGLNQLETQHWSLELALERLTSFSEALQQKGHGLGQGVSDDSSNVLKGLNDARQELERLNSTSGATSYMWVGVLTKPSPSPGTNRRESGSFDLIRSVSMQQPGAVSPGRKKKRDVSLLLYDVQVVTSFVSCVLLWVLTGQSRDENFPSTVEVLEPSPKLKRVPSWPTFMIRLKKVVEQSFEELQCSTRNMKLQDMKYFQSSLSLLRAELEEGSKEGKLARGSAFAERMKTLLEQEKQKLGELDGSLERISAQLNEMFTEIMGRRKRVLDTFELSLYHQASV